MRFDRLLLAAIALSALGCNSVTFEELDGFGLFGPDATWLEVENQFGTFETLVLASDGGLCGRLENAITSCEEHFATILDAEGQCNDDSLEAFKAIVDIATELSPPNRRRMNISVQSQDGTEFDEDSFDVGGFPAATVDYVVTGDESPFAAIKDDIDDETCTSSQNITDFFDVFTAEDGRIEILEINGDRIRGEFRFDMTDDSAESKGEVQGSFAGQKCAINVDDDARQQCFQLLSI